MTTLRQHFIRELVIRGMAPKTQEAYVRAVRDLARHYHKAPDLVTDDEIKDYLLHLVAGRQLAPSSVNVAVNGMRCFYDLVMKRECEHLKRIVPALPEGDPPSAGLQHRRTGAPVHGRLRAPQAPGVSDDRLRRRLAAGRSLPAQASPHRQRAHADPGRGGQRAQGSLHPALAAAAAGVARLLPHVPPQRMALLRARPERALAARPPARRSSTTRRNGPGCPTEAASTACATALPRTCWSRAWRSRSCNGCWAIPASRPLRFTCTCARSGWPRSRARCNCCSSPKPDQLSQA